MNADTISEGVTTYGLIVLGLLAAALILWKVFSKEPEKTHGLTYDEGTLNRSTRERKEAHTLFGVQKQQQYAAEDIAESSFAIYEKLEKIEQQQYIANRLALEELKTRPEASSAAVQEIEALLEQYRAGRAQDAS